jgi:hypothetical protein
MEYDWGRLRYLQVMYGELEGLLERDLGRFDRFLQALDRACSQQREQTT